MSVLTLLLIRHGEKPDRGFPGNGFTAEGDENKKSLVIRGWQRAGAWAALLGAGTLPDYPRPDLVYAAAPQSQERNERDSNRPYETSLPLAGRLHVEPIARWGVGQEKQLADELMALTGVIAVFWEHKTLVKNLVPALLQGQKLPGVPTKWKGDRFDVILRLDRALPDAPWTFRQLSPRLLSGDSDAPVSEKG